LGELLLELKEPALALKEFEVSFEAARNRLRGLAGAASAAQKIGDSRKAAALYEKILTLGEKRRSRCGKRLNRPKRFVRRVECCFYR